MSTMGSGIARGTEKNRGEGRHSHVAAHKDVLPKWVTFSLKIFRHGSHFVQKILKKKSPISRKLQKLVKLAVFKVEKPLKMGPNLQKF